MGLSLSACRISAAIATASSRALRFATSQQAYLICCSNTHLKRMP